MKNLSSFGAIARLNRGEMETSDRLSEDGKLYRKQEDGMMTRIFLPMRSKTHRIINAISQNRPYSNHNL